MQTYYHRKQTNAFKPLYTLFLTSSSMGLFFYFHCETCISDQKIADKVKSDILGSSFTSSTNSIVKLNLCELGFDRIQNCTRTSRKYNMNNISEDSKTLINDGIGTWFRELPFLNLIPSSSKLAFCEEQNDVKDDQEKVKSLPKSGTIKESADAKKTEGKMKIDEGPSETKVVPDPLDKGEVMKAAMLDAYKEDPEEERYKSVAIELDPECPFCKLMTGSPCNERWISFHQCVDWHKERDLEFIMPCRKLALRLFDCIQKNPDHFPEGFTKHQPPGVQEEKENPKEKPQST